MSDLNQFLNQGMSADDVAHTNGFANTGAGGLSMEERRKRLNQPRVIGEYKYSKLGSQASSSKAKTADQNHGRVYDASSDTFVDDAAISNRQKNDIKDTSRIEKSVEKRQRFIEPPSRGYDKFA